MPRSIHIWIGLEVQEVFFTQECNDDPVFQHRGYAIGEKRNKPGEVRIVPGPGYNLVENGFHPKNLAAHVSELLDLTPSHINCHFSTHSMNTLNVISEFIREGKINAEQVFIHILEDDNRSIKQESSFDSDGYLVNWPVGELSI